MLLLLASQDQVLQVNLGLAESSSGTSCHVVPALHLERRQNSKRVLEIANAMLFCDAGMLFLCSQILFYIQILKLVLCCRHLYSYRLPFGKVLFFCNHFLILTYSISSFPGSLPSLCWVCFGFWYL